MRRIKYFITSILAVFLLCGSSAFAQSTKKPITIKLNTTKTGREIPPEILGLSYETKDILPDEAGKYYFSPDNKALLKIFKIIGIKVLRIGGNSVDASNIAIPKAEDIHSLFKFAKAANVKVIYSVRLQDGEPEAAQKAAKIIYTNYKELLESFSIGNEPSYYKEYDVYKEKWIPIRDAILKVYPDARFCGPDQNPDVERLKEIAADFGTTEGHLVELTQHSYPFGCSYNNYLEKDVNKLQPVEKDPAREKMLNPDAYAIYEEILQGMEEVTKGTSLSFRLSETNSYWFSGLEGVSDSYASALWGLDYLHWWASHGVSGLNFHTGDITGGSIRLPCRYAAFVSSDKGFEARPIAYGMKLFGMGSDGKTIPAEITNSSGSNIVAYATVNEEKTVYLTIINKEYKSTEARKILIKTDNPLKGTKVRFIALGAENNDIAAGSNSVTIGGAAIKADGSWKGKWQKVPTSDINNNEISVTIPPASGLLIKIID